MLNGIFILIWNIFFFNIKIKQKNVTKGVIKHQNTIKGVINSKIISGDTNYRKYINDLKKWLNSRNRKPLMILGGLHYEEKNLFLIIIFIWFLISCTGIDSRKIEKMLDNSDCLYIMMNME